MKTHVNLLSARARKRQFVRRFLRNWGSTWVVCLIVAMGSCCYQWQRTRKLQAALTQSEEKYSGVAIALRQEDALRSRIRRHEAERDRYLSISNKELLLSVIGVLAKSANASGGELRLDSFSMREVPIANGKQPVRQHRVTIDVEGSATSDQTIGMYVASLRAARVFQAVALRSSRRDNGTKKAARRFQIQCVLIASLNVRRTDGKRRVASK